MPTVKLIEMMEKLPPDIKAVLLEFMKEFERTEEMRQKIIEMDEKMKNLVSAVNDLTRAQKETEERIKELIQAQKRTEEILSKHEDRLSRVEKVLEELAQAQKRTEERLERLEREVEKLTENVNKLAIQAEKNASEVRNIKGILAGLSDSVGFSLEDRALVDLPYFLRKKFDLSVDTLKTVRVEHRGKEYELNIYGVGIKDGKRTIILGKCKTRMTLKEINRFMKIVKRIGNLLKERERAEDIFLLSISYRYEKSVLEKLDELGIYPITSVDLERSRKEEYLIELKELIKSNR